MCFMFDHLNRTMKALLVALSMMLFSGNALAAGQPQWFMDAIKQDNPNELAYLLGIGSDCPITKPEAEKIVEGVILRSRVKAVGGLAFFADDLYLEVEMQCLELTRGDDKASIAWANSINVAFGQYKNKPAFLLSQKYGGIAIGGVSSMKASLKNYVEKAMTAYVEANFVQ